MPNTATKPTATKLVNNQVTKYENGVREAIAKQLVAKLQQDPASTATLANVRTAKNLKLWSGMQIDFAMSNPSGATALTTAEWFALRECSAHVLAELNAADAAGAADADVQ